MANPRSTFGKRQREQDRKDKARAKEARLAARRSGARIAKGPEIAWDEAHQTEGGEGATNDTGAPPPPPTDEQPSSD